MEEMSCRRRRRLGGDSRVSVVSSSSLSWVLRGQVHGLHSLPKSPWVSFFWPIQRRDDMETPRGRARGSYPTHQSSPPHHPNRSPSRSMPDMALLLLLRANPIPLPFSTAPPASVSGWSSSTAARCSSLKLSAVQFQEPLRSDSDPWGAEATTDDADEEQQHDEAEEDLEPEADRKGISGIHVPRQRYIAVPKAALLDAVLPLFSSDAAAEEFKRFARCLDAVLHAEHKQMLEEMRTYYMLTKQQQQEEDGQVVNGRTTAGFFGITQEDGTVFLTRSLGLRTLLGLSPDPDSQTRYYYILVNE